MPNITNNSTPLIKNIDSLSINNKRQIVLSLVEEALNSIQPKNVINTSFNIIDNFLYVKDKKINLKNYERIFLIGIGKGSAGISRIVEEKLGKALTKGFIIDNVPQVFDENRIYFVQGTHPLPSQTNIDFTQYVLANITNLTSQDLVLVVLCGGGSAMFELPYKLTTEHLVPAYNEFLKSGADIKEMNVIRKHLSLVKGGGLAKHLYPARVEGLVFSDVPGDDLSTIASGPLTKDKSTLEDVKELLIKYNSSITLDNFREIPQEDKYFDNVTTTIMASNSVALEAMKNKVEELGYKSAIYSTHFQGDAKEVGKQLINEARDGEILLVGGETTLKVKGNGKGGRNQTLVLAALSHLKENEMIVSFDTDGVDNYHFAGAIGDMDTVSKAKTMQLDSSKYLEDDNSYEFFEKVGDGIYTDKLESNVSDLMIISKI